MFSVDSMKRLLLPVILLGLSSLMAACDGVMDDLKPSGADKQPDAGDGSLGITVGQQSPDFALFNTEGESVGLADELTRADAVVLYFNMWCPICDAHASNMRREIIPNFPEVSFFLVDYVTGSISASRRAQLENGYGDIETLVDAEQELFDLYEASMGTTIVIDSGMIVRMNEDYKDGVKLEEILQALP
mgnify:CR=1 FL=1